MTSRPYRVSVILLAGGVGSRMNADIPKQYLQLGDKAIARYSFDCLSLVPEVSEIIVVCEKDYYETFESEMPDVDLSFAAPGRRRQDSVYSGFKAIVSDPDLICIHDAARPFISVQLVRRVLEAGYDYGAATAAMPVKFTVKEANDEHLVINTPDRSKLWEIQTPQVLKPKILKQGFEHVHEHGLTVTDDVSLAEQIGLPVKLVEGDYSNLKITTPQDLVVAEESLKTRTPSQRVFT